MSGEGKKFDQGKPDMTMIPSSYVLGTADVFSFGAQKYARGNFRLGMEHSRPLAAALRHIYAILDGQEIDPESGKPHIYHASCSLAMYDYQRLNHPNLNNLEEYVIPRDRRIAGVNPAIASALRGTANTDAVIKEIGDLFIPPIRTEREG